MQTARNLSISSFRTAALKKKAINNIIGIVAFFVLVIFCVLFLENLFLSTGSVTERKQAVAQREQNSVDVMVIGNSHAYCTFNPAVMEEIIDKRVLNAGLPDQKIDMTYYSLLEMLEKQKPETIILEAFVFGRTNSEYKGFVANLDAMKLSFNKLRACFEIFPDKYEAIRMSFSSFRSHNNWKKPHIVKENLKTMLGRPSKNYDSFDGFYALNSKMSAGTIRQYKESTTSKFTPVVDEYSTGFFRRIVKLCNERNIRLVVAMAPFNELYLEKVEYRSFYEKMERLCKDEGVKYVDFNMLYDEIGLNYDDFEDAFHHAQHMNIWGAEKVSAYMAEYLKASE